MDIFDKDTIEKIEYAIVFENLSHGGSTAKTIYRETVKEKASKNGNDVLTFFYGNNVYDKIDSAALAVESICVANELHKFYSLIGDIGGMMDEHNCWANYDNRHRDTHFKRFFTWLGDSEKKPKESDISIINEITYLLSYKGSSVSKNPNVKAAAYYNIEDVLVRNYSFFELISRILDGRIKVCADGDLKKR